ncbi:glycosyltransferase [Ferrovibrio sp.]|uniref:glycosyltransferase n=1 Tax=Ferrovibrio sp. TaxID=1917215 RepID=UPI00261B7C83|nr:glycosyltransferase [Ferrovibrio sp.]
MSGQPEISPDTRPEISFVIPVYNKADILPHALAALAAQKLDVAAEYIFVDDASQDGSPDILQAHGSAFPLHRILRNTKNAGPSIRLNQGAREARGRYLCLIDADELIAPDAVAAMLRLLRQNHAEMAHGKVMRTALAAAEIHPPAIGMAPSCAISDQPLKTILNGRGFVRMAWLVETAVFQAAGGCDERLFIQDESLPLRLALKARRLVDLQADVMWAPQAASHLSANKRQQHHDRFFAYYHLLHDNPALDAADRRRARAICASIAWKAIRKSGLRLAFATALAAYLAGKLGIDIPGSYLEKAAAAFRAMPGIRKP